MTHPRIVAEIRVAAGEQAGHADEIQTGGDGDSFLGPRVCFALFGGAEHHDDGAGPLAPAPRDLTKARP